MRGFSAGSLGREPSPACREHSCGTQSHHAGQVLAHMRPQSLAEPLWDTCQGHCSEEFMWISLSLSFWEGQSTRPEPCQLLFLTEGWPLGSARCQLSGWRG